jgi:hypothetical protein
LKMTITLENKTSLCIPTRSSTRLWDYIGLNYPIYWMIDHHCKMIGKLKSPACASWTLVFFSLLSFFLLGLSAEQCAEEVNVFLFILFLLISCDKNTRKVQTPNKKYRSLLRTQKKRYWPIYLDMNNNLGPLVTWPIP